MSIIVQKYGGTSVGDTDRIMKVAERVARRHRQGNRVVVVVSAMGHTTDELLSLAEAVNAQAPARELDMLLATGEQVSVALLAMALEGLGCPAVSLTGWQAGINTDETYGRARITTVCPERVLAELEAGKVVVVAGFQGLTPRKDISTIGRGGSDMTAVALAAALGVQVCEIYTDVEGVFTADPRIVPEARKLEEIGYSEMMELASLGAQVLQLRSVEYAEQCGVHVHVRSSFSDRPGTLVKEVKAVENVSAIRGVAFDPKVARIAVLEVPDRPGIAHRLFSALGAEGIQVDMIIQSVNRDGINDISFTVSEAVIRRAVQVAEAVAAEIGARGVVSDPDVCKVSVVGAAVASNPMVPATMFGALADEGINIEMISTSEIKISCVVRAHDGPRAVRAIHARFGLGDTGMEMTGA